MIFGLSLWSSGSETRSRLINHDPPWAVAPRKENIEEVSEILVPPTGRIPLLKSRQENCSVVTKRVTLKWGIRHIQQNYRISWKSSELFNPRWITFANLIVSIFWKFNKVILKLLLIFSFILIIPYHFTKDSEYKLY